MKENIYKYKNGFREGVLFLFYKEGQVLLEDRGKGFENEAFFPNGSIEIKDIVSEQNNYINVALYREINEEFDGNIKIYNEEFLGELIVEEINVLFYIFLIRNWRGQFPVFIKEAGEPDSKIQFFSIEEALEIVQYASAKTVLSRLEKHLSDKV